jgi:hypothetical protein
MQDRDVDDRLTDLNRRRSGMGSGTIAAIVAALVIIGALFMWGQRSTTNTAANPTPGTTVGQTSNPPTMAPPPSTNTPANPATTTPAAPASTTR